MLQDNITVSRPAGLGELWMQGLGRQAVVLRHGTKQWVTVTSASAQHERVKIANLPHVYISQLKWWQPITLKQGNRQSSVDRLATQYIAIFDITTKPLFTFLWILLNTFWTKITAIPDKLYLYLFFIERKKRLDVQIHFLSGWVKKFRAATLLIKKKIMLKLWCFGRFGPLYFTAKAKVTATAWGHQTGGWVPTGEWAEGWALEEGKHHGRRI